MFPAAPNRTNCVNDEPGGQTISASSFRLAGFTTTKGSTLCNQFGSRGAMNRAIDSPTTEKCRVRRVHDRIHFELRDIAAHDVDLSSRFFTHNRSSSMQKKFFVRVRGVFP